jgi:bifunctional pyridoxal-dependent enzyme with beta-cystathionase and maltose regulon repressor activities
MLADDIRLGRIVVPEDGYLAEVHALCKEHNVLLICDEIQTVCPSILFYPSLMLMNDV